MQQAMWDFEAHSSEIAGNLKSFVVINNLLLAVLLSRHTTTKHEKEAQNFSHSAQIVYYLKKSVEC